MKLKHKDQRMSKQQRLASPYYEMNTTPTRTESQAYDAQIGWYGKEPVPMKLEPTGVRKYKA